MILLTEKHHSKMKGKKIKQTLIFTKIAFQSKKKKNNQRQGNKP